MHFYVPTVYLALYTLKSIQGSFLRPGAKLSALRTEQPCSFLRPVSGTRKCTTPGRPALTAC